MKYIVGLLAALTTAIILFIIRDFIAKALSVEIPLNTSFLIGWVSCMAYKGMVSYFDYKTFEREFRKK